MSGTRAPQPLATEAPVCEWLQIDPEQFKLMLKRKKGPRAINLSRTERRFAWPDVHAWAKQLRDPDDGK
ncbi:hypothetical protein BMH30_01290 [Leucobacter sp. OLES1]|nr:hypothetical protein BMH30_01290 [Leucobacter sp. OLES1]